MCFDDSETEPQIIIKSWDREMIKPKLEKTNKNLLNDDSAVQTLIIGKVKSATKSRFRIRPKVHAHIIRIAG